VIWTCPQATHKIARSVTEPDIESLPWRSPAHRPCYHGRAICLRILSSCRDAYQPSSPSLSLTTTNNLRNWELLMSPLCARSDNMSVLLPRQFMVPSALCLLIFLLLQEIATIHLPPPPPSVLTPVTKADEPSGFIVDSSAFHGHPRWPCTLFLNKICSEEGLDV
jgi:hypothetical protein